MQGAQLEDPRVLRTESWGVVDYETALARQLDLVAERQQRRRGDTLVAVEHPPTITLGRNAPASDVLAPTARFAAAGGCEPSDRPRVCRSDRGGGATYHGPGQSVVYPIVDIAARRIGVRAWVSLLEDTVRAVLTGASIASEIRPGQPGLWTEGGKIAALGLRVTRGVSYHGVAINVSLDPTVFDCIVPCGVRGQPITTMAATLETPPAVSEVSARFISRLSEALREFSRPWPEQSATPKN